MKRHPSFGPVPDYIDVPGWKTTGRSEVTREDGRRIICVEVEAAEDPHPLHYCANPTIRGNGRRPLTFYDIPRGDTPVQIVYRRRRWRCYAWGIRIYRTSSTADHPRPDPG